jgi:serine/threonine protein kinase/formylglycine-generating enzyme required for sulfatase activity
MEDHPDGIDQAALNWLAEFDEALAEGLEHCSLEDASIPAELRAGLRPIIACIERINRVWPSSRLSGAGGASERAPAAGGAPSFQLPGFEIMEEAGRGGMGVVFRAKRLNLGSEVALKVLPTAFAADPKRRRRFRQEAEVAASITSSRVLPVFDLLEADGGVLVLVMPFIRGHDLGRILADRVAFRRGEPRGGAHPSSMLDEEGYLDLIFPLLDQVVAAVAIVHGAGVLHRDIKPSNILVDEHGDVRLTDFGLARLGPSEEITTDGDRPGTRGFMGPERWSTAAGIDERTDVFSLGVTLYQVLTLRLPYGTDRITLSSPLPSRPGRWCPSLAERAPGLDRVILKALEPNPSRRYASAIELRDDWQRVRAKLPPRNAYRPSLLRGAVHRVSRHPWTMCGIAAVALGISAFSRRREDSPKADSAVRPVALRTVALTTKPAGARAIFVPLDQDDGRPHPENAVVTPPGTMTPTRLSLRPGAYLVEVELAGRGFQEVRRLVPREGERSGIYRHQRWFANANGEIELAEIEIPDASIATDMAYFPGSEDYAMGSEATQSGPHRTSVFPYYLDTVEVTVGRYLQVAIELPPPLRAAARDDEAVRFISFDEALHYAERLGKRLPDEVEYEYAATAGGTRAYPWGDSSQPLRDHTWAFGPVGNAPFDRTNTVPPVYGLYSNVAEWTTSWINSPPAAPSQPIGGPLASFLPADYRTARIVRGGSPSVIRGEPVLADILLGPRARQAITRMPVPRAPGLGFRCARSAWPRFLRTGAEGQRRTGIPRGGLNERDP